MRHSAECMLYVFVCLAGWCGDDRQDQYFKGENILHWWENERSNVTVDHTSALTHTHTGTQVTHSSGSVESGNSPVTAKRACTCTHSIRWKAVRHINSLLLEPICQISYHFNKSAGFSCLTCKASYNVMVFFFTPYKSVRPATTLGNWHAVCFCIFGKIWFG